MESELLNYLSKKAFKSCLESAIGASYQAFFPFFQSAFRVRYVSLCTHSVTFLLPRVWLLRTALIDAMTSTFIPDREDRRQNGIFSWISGWLLTLLIGDHLECLLIRSVFTYSGDPADRIMPEIYGYVYSMNGVLSILGP